jgi:hypothetical protein
VQGVGVTDAGAAPGDGCRGLAAIGIESWRAACVYAAAASPRMRSMWPATVRTESTSRSGISRLVGRRRRPFAPKTGSPSGTQVVLRILVQLPRR